jgi:alpha-L-fucosidase 2
MAEMLLQSQDGVIQLLPALPAAWRDGKVSGLRARGGFEVSLAWRDGKLTRGTIHSDLGARCFIRYGGQTVICHMLKGQSFRFK